MKSTYSISYISSFLVVVCYVTFTAIAWARFPLPYSPIHNWLSDLGNPEINPKGALFYNLGLAITAGLVMTFFLSLFRFRLKNVRVQTIMVILTVAFGCLGALAMLMTTIFPINQPALHSFWSAANRICTGTAFAFSIAAFRYHCGYPRWMLGLGVIVVLVDLVSSAFLTEIHVAEWVTIALWLAYCLLLGIETRHTGYESNNSTIEKGFVI
jgi:hypothetical membrane protein